MAALSILIGLVINKLVKVHDYIQIEFSDGTTLSIFNNHHYDRGSVRDVEGKTVESIEEGDDKITITLEDGRCLSVGMGDDDYNGPEAMVLRRKGEPIVVWN